MPKTTLKPKIGPERNLKFLRQAPEVSIFLACVAAVNQLRQLAKAYETGELSRVAFSRRSTTLVADLTELASATERFDIVCPVLEFGGFSPFFWRWFNWWSDYLHEFSGAQVSHLVRATERAGGYSESCRPKDHWLRYRQTPAFALVIT